MLLSLTQSSFLGILPLMLMLNLLQWEDVTSAPVHHNEVYYDDMSLKDLFDQAIVLSKDTTTLTIEMRMIFVLDFLKDQRHMAEALSSCHTFSLSIPETMEEARKISLKDFLKIILSILNAWNKPLYHLETELHRMKGAPDALVVRANAIRTLNGELIETVMMMLRKVHPGMKEKNDYPLWKDLASLQATDKERQFLTLYKLFYCLRVDTFTVDLYLKHLMCTLYSGDICNSVRFYQDPW
ncbi:prolactin-7C1-like isoform X2 [Mastomys coucha]|uniref:prolactin-7C1-like isoform X2 n=1 Tax=Mastomys coucha TaxID=35658 RepID=UPI00126284FB|nr:prolactin-7C1-like isoform X2 [Mastomys coucha]